MMSKASVEAQVPRTRYSSPCPTRGGGPFEKPARSLGHWSFARRASGATSSGTSSRRTSRRIPTRCTPRADGPDGATSSARTVGPEAGSGATRRRERSSDPSGSVRLASGRNTVGAIEHTIWDCVLETSRRVLEARIAVRVGPTQPTSSASPPRRAGSSAPLKRLGATLAASACARVTTGDSGAWTAIARPMSRRGPTTSTRARAGAAGETSSARASPCPRARDRLRSSSSPARSPLEKCAPVAA